MASASLATARMSSAPLLFDIRKVGLRRASAAFAGSRVGNTLSVTAMTGPLMYCAKVGKFVAHVTPEQRLASTLPAYSNPDVSSGNVRSFSGPGRGMPYGLA